VRHQSRSLNAQRDPEKVNIKQGSRLGSATHRFLFLDGQYWRDALVPVQLSPGWAFLGPCFLSRCRVGGGRDLQLRAGLTSHRYLTLKVLSTRDN